MNRTEYKTFSSNLLYTNITNVNALNDFFANPDEKWLADQFCEALQTHKRLWIRRMAKSSTLQRGVNWFEFGNEYTVLVAYSKDSLRPTLFCESDMSPFDMGRYNWVKTDGCAIEKMVSNDILSAILKHVPTVNLLQHGQFVNRRWNKTIRERNSLWEPCILRLQQSDTFIPSLVCPTTFETVVRHTLCHWPSLKLVKFNPEFLISAEFAAAMRISVGHETFTRDNEMCAEYLENSNKRRRTDKTKRVELIQWRTYGWSRCKLEVVWERYPRGRKLSVNWLLLKGSDHPLAISWRDGFIKSKILL